MGRNLEITKIHPVPSGTAYEQTLISLKRLLPKIAFGYSVPKGTGFDNIDLFSTDMQSLRDKNQ